jgi:hypothetical protein
MRVLNPLSLLEPARVEAGGFLAAFYVAWYDLIVAFIVSVMTYHGACVAVLLTLTRAAN